MLTKKNKRMVRKMKKYIKTFPLTEKEIDQMIEDITGMAEEAQERNENFETVLGKSVHEFCDDLIYSVGGIRAPGGRKLIRGTSIYFQLLGLWGIVGPNPSEASKFQCLERFHCFPAVMPPPAYH